VTDKKKMVKVIAEENVDTAVIEAETKTTATITITTTDTVMGESTLPTPGSEEVTIATSRALSAAVGKTNLWCSHKYQLPLCIFIVNSPPVLEDAECRFVSTFRGRAIHELTVSPPESYAGLFLKSIGKESMRVKTTIPKRSR
jgi:hypothetical protein